MRIFLPILKELIREQLNAASTGQNAKVNTGDPLATFQKKKIDDVSTAIESFQEGLTAAEDCQKITQMIVDARDEIQTERIIKGKTRDSGKTMTTFSNLQNHIRDFYKKLEEFDLTNFQYFQSTPEGILFHCAAYYLGQEIFVPKYVIEQDIRTEKEQTLKAQLLFYSNIKPQAGLLNQIYPILMSFRFYAPII